jgi:PAS domain S-box-containing protein
MYLKKELYSLIQSDESIFDFIQESLLDGLWYWDLEKPENEWMNARFWTVLGYNPDEMPHKSAAWQGIINQDDLKLASDNFIKHCENPNHPYDQIVRYTHKNGSTVWIRCRGMAIRDNTGKPIRMLGAHHDITDYKQAKEKAEESVEKFRLLHENAGLGIGYYTPDGIILSFNQIAARQMNGKPEDFIEKSVFELFPKESADIYYNRLQNAIISSQPLVYEDFVQLPTEDKWFISTHTKIENSQQKVLGIQIISQDVTKLKTTEIELQKAKEKAEESEEKFRKSIEFSPVPMAVAKNNGDLLFLNKQFVESFGYSIEELGSIQKWFELAYPDVEYRNSRFNQWSSDIDFSVKNRVPAPVREGLVTCKNGVVKTVEISISVDNDISIGLFLDITERKQAENSLLKSETEFRQLAEAMPQIVWITRPDGSNIFFNQQWVDYTGLSLTESYGDGWNKPFHPDDQQRAWDAWANATTNLAIYSIECRLRRFDGEYKWWLIRGVPMMDAEGTVLKWFGTCTDIDEIKRSQAELLTIKERAEESEANLKAALENSQAGIAIAEYPSGKLKYVNKAALLIRDKEYDEIVKDIDLDNYVASWQILHFDGTPYQTDEVPLARAILYGETSSREFIVRRDNNEDRYVWANAAPIYNAKGIQTSAIVVFLDITLRKQAEQALLAKIDELERFQKITIGREITMVELKKEVNRLLNKMGEDNKYRIIE